MSEINLMSLPDELLLCIAESLYTTDRCMFALSCKRVCSVVSTHHVIDNKIPYNLAKELGWKSSWLPYMNVILYDEHHTSGICKRLSTISVDSLKLRWSMFENIKTIYYKNRHMIKTSNIMKDFDRLVSLKHPINLQVNGIAFIHNNTNIQNLKIVDVKRKNTCVSAIYKSKMTQIIYNMKLKCNYVDNCKITYNGRRYETYVDSGHYSSMLTTNNCNNIEIINSNYIEINNTSSCVIRCDGCKDPTLILSGYNVYTAHIYMKSIQTLMLSYEFVRSKNGIYLYYTNDESLLVDVHPIDLSSYSYTVEPDIHSETIYDAILSNPRSFGVREIKITIEGLFTLIVFTRLGPEPLWIDFRD